MTVFIKIAFALLYYLLASIFDQIFIMFFGNAYLSFAFTCLSLCIISCEFRKANIYKRNYLQEQRDAYSRSFKTKLRHIVVSVDFLAETVIGTIVCLLFMIIPRVAVGACYAFELLYINRAYALLLVPFFMVINFLIWYFAYQKSFRKKKY